MQTLPRTAVTGASPGGRPAGAGTGWTASTVLGRLRYGTRFYRRIEQADLPATTAVVQRVLDLVPTQGVVDLGCGTGRWLGAFKDCGVEDVLGVDGPWVSRQMLSISLAELEVEDLTRPLDLGRGFDLAVSLGVAGACRRARSRW